MLWCMCVCRSDDRTVVMALIKSFQLFHIERECVFLLECAPIEIRISHVDCTANSLMSIVFGIANSGNGVALASGLIVAIQPDIN